MPRDIAPLTRALDDATRGEQRDVYGLLAAWDQSIETATDRGGWSRFQEIVRQYLEEVIDVVDAAATTDGVDWGFLQQLLQHRSELVLSIVVVSKALHGGTLLVEFTRSLGRFAGGFQPVHGVTIPL